MFRLVQEKSDGRIRYQMSELDDDVQRGCLSNGEPIEARWGQGYWSEVQNAETDPWGGEPCPDCGTMLHTFCGEFAEPCPICDWVI